jgi:GDPmannose 4,6-dehydratase
LDVERDWGWAPEYVHAMWLMLQQGQAEDFVIATGRPQSLRRFVELAFAEVGLDWRTHVDIDESLRRPTDIAHSSGSPVRARTKLGWTAVYQLEDVIRFMVAAEAGGAWPSTVDGAFVGRATR